MSTKTTATEVAAAADEDPRIAGKDPSMIPGHPQCNYEKFMAAQRKVTVICPSDQRNPQFKTLKLSFNGHQIEVPYDRPVEVPEPYGAQVVLGSLGTTTDAKLMQQFAGQVSRPITGPIPGPLSGSYADEQPF